MTDWMKIRANDPARVHGQLRVPARASEHMNP